MIKVETDRADPKEIVGKSPLIMLIILLGGVICLLFGLALSVISGTADISLSTVWEACFHFNAELETHQIVVNLRLPRALTGALIGASFAVAGAMMQGVTRNPLADTGLLGINAGSGLVLAIVIAFFPSLSFGSLIYFSFLGAGLGVALIYGLAYAVRGALTPLRLILAGAVIGTLMKGMTQIISLLTGTTYELAFWSAGGISAAEWVQVKMISPWVITGLISAIILSPKLTILSLGEEVATGLGQHTSSIKLISGITVLLLVGASVPAVGGVGFIGLIIPHIVRFLVGEDYRLIIPCSAMLGAVIVVFADIGAKLINMPYETPLGSIMAVIGVPFFLYLARKETKPLL
ncbi:FecCD family ABC transporter permease [Paenibacillus pinistramenti]|uniref:FecCD family ABC transporter permease n=1 Tax=Paenibacillus pinistramenti TaxID=1768003 RepID=UPI0011091A23|nr:iron ABC transporter permease [Paenibacillus pinistramenti]